MTKPRRQTPPPDLPRASRHGKRKSTPPEPRYSTARAKKKSKAADALSPREEETQVLARVPSTRPPPPIDPPPQSESRLKRADASETSIAELIAELMIDLSPYGPSKASRDARRAGKPQAAKGKLPKAVVDEVVADRKKDPRAD